MNKDKSRILKEVALTHCNTFVAGRLKRLERQTREISAALTSETKSSAGDKHETGRAMLQLEREKIGAQYYEAEKMQFALGKVELQENVTYIGLGTLVYTTEHCYFISVSAGAFTYSGQEVYCVSAVTPIGKLLLGKQKGDIFTFLNKENKILSVT